MTGRIVRPAELPRQRGHQTDRVLARPAGRPSGRPTSPRSARRAPRTDWFGVADSTTGFVLVALTVAATVVAIGVVGAAVLGF